MATARKQKSGANQTDIINVLTREHKVVDGIMTKIEKACEDESYDEVTEAFAVLKTKLTAHARGEEMKVYPALRDVNDELKDLIGEANEEHALVHDKLAELSDISVEDDEWKAKFTVLKDLVTHHVEEEEGELFPAARKGVDEALLTAMTDEYLEAKREVVGDKADEITPLELEVMTKEDLLQQARQMGVEGTASMTKAELVQAMSQNA